MRATAIVTYAAVWLFLGGVAAAQTPSNLEVHLHKEPLPTSGERFIGITNIFFEAVQDEDLNLLPEWDGVEVAEVASGEEFRPVYAIRYSDAADSVHYLLDTDTDLDFTDEEPLRFRKVGGVVVADAEVRIRPPAGTGDATFNPTAYQMIRSDDGYVYARISEYRRGWVEVGGESFEVALRPSGRNEPLFAVSPNTLLFIDQDQDGAFQERWAVSDSGAVVETESADVTGPFLLGEQPFEVVEVNPDGTRLVLQPSEAEVAPTAGFTAPALSAYDLNGNLHRLSDYTGRAVVLEFWSVHCPFCERARPQLNAIAEQFGGSDFEVIAIAREADAEEVHRHLKDHPKDATILLYDEAAWEEFNPQGATPTIYLIGPDGTIQLRGQGSAVVEPLSLSIGKFVGNE